MFATVHNTHIPQYSLHVCPDSRASNTGDRWSVTGLAGEVDVHVSTISPAKQSHSESQEGKVILKARWFLHLSVCGHPRIIPGPTVTTGACLGWQVVPFACMEALMQHYQVAGFTKRGL